MTKKKVSLKKASAKAQRDRIKKAIAPVKNLAKVPEGPFAHFESVEDRVEYVRDAVAKASDGVSGDDYTHFFEDLLADAEGWKGDLSNREEAAKNGELEGGEVVVVVPVPAKPEASAKPDEEE